MSYQQSSPPNAQAFARSLRKKGSWSDPAQIVANQQGIVTREQRTLLDKGPGCSSTLIFVLFIYSILATCITLAVVIYTLFTGKLIVFENSNVFMLVIPLVLTVVLGRKRYAEIWYAPVQNIENNLQTRDASSGDSDIYYYDIGQLHFKVPESAFKALMSGMRCRVYYLVSSKTLVSVEPLEVPVR